MKVLIENIRSIKELEIEMPDVGVVQFIGDNSHGKSILIYALTKLTSKTILDAEVRTKYLIRRGETDGYLSMIRTDGYTINFRINEERDKTICQLKRPDGTKITRSLREGGWNSLFDEFGFMIFDNGDTTIQFHNTFGTMPFINTSPKLNYTIVESISLDSMAKQFVDTYKDVTHKSAKSLLETVDIKIDESKKALKAVKPYDYVPYNNIKVELEKCERKLLGLSKLEIERIDIPPMVSILDLKMEKLPLIPIVKPLPVLEEIDSLSSIITTLDTLAKGVCPTCEREFS